MSCLHPIRTCFSITCPRLGDLHCQEVLMNTDFLEDAVVKAKVFFREVVLPELLTGNIKKGLDAATTCTSHPCMNNDICTEESEVDFPCGKCGLECLGEPVEFNELSIGCDFCNQWFHWQCTRLTGNESFLADNSTWMCDCCQSNPSTT